MSDALAVTFIFVGIPFVIIALVSFILHYFVALGSPPHQRAAWIVGIAYVVASAIWIFGGMGDYEWLGPLAALPGALLALWWWRNDFRRDWIDDAAGTPEGVELANTDWRIGLAGIVAVIVVASVKVLFLREAVGG